MSAIAPPEAKPRLLVLTSTYPRWRDDILPPFVHELSRRLAEHFAVHVLAPHAPGSKCHECMDGVEVHRFRYGPTALEQLAYGAGIPANLKRRPWLWLLLPAFLLTQLIASRRLVRQLDPAAIHAHWLLPQGLMAALAGGRARRIITAHGSDLRSLRGWFSSALKRWVLGRCEAVTVVSEPLADLAHALLDDPNKLRVMPMGVDLTTRFVPAKPPPDHRADAPRLVFAGRLVALKGVKELIAAMPEVLAQVPGASLVLAGDGPLRPALEQQVRRLGIAERVSFHGGYRNDALPALLQDADLAVLPFLRNPDGAEEGLGLVTVEALGCGVPVIAGDVPGVRDVISHDQTGWLVNAGDPAALAGAMIGMIQDPTRRARLAAQGRQSVLTRYDWSQVAAGYTRLLSPP